MLKQIQENIVTMTETQKKVHRMTQELKTTHQSIQATVVDKISGVRKDSIKPYIERIGDTRKMIHEKLKLSVERSLVMKTFCLNPLMSVLKKIENLLFEIDSLFASIIAPFSKVNKQLDFKKDPKKIYKNLQLADENFSNAIKKLQQLELALENV